MNPDILAACIAYLRSQSGIVATFGDSTAAPHFWSDYAGPIAPALPYAVFTEPGSKEGFETIDQSNEIWSVMDGVVACEVFAASKTQARQLADLIGSALNDAELNFCGIASAGDGTVAATYNSNTLTFGASQSGLQGLYLTIAGDTSVGTSFNGLYTVTSGAGASWTISPNFGGASLAAAPWTTAQQAGLIYFRRTGHSFPVLTDIGPDGTPTIFSRVVQFRFMFEQMDEVIA